MRRFVAAVLCPAFAFVFAFASEHAQSPTGANVPAAVEDTVAGADAACCQLPAGHLIDLEIAQPLNSWEFKRGDAFLLTVAVPVLVDSREVIPAGTPVHGEIVHAAAARGGGAPGELLIAARSLEVSGQILRLRGLKLGGAGDDNSGMALGVSFAAGPFAMFIRGTEIEIPPGTRVHAKLAEDVHLAPASNVPTPQPTAELP